MTYKLQQLFVLEFIYLLQILNQIKWIIYFKPHYIWFQWKISIFRINTLYRILKIVYKFLVSFYILRVRSSLLLIDYVLLSTPPHKSPLTSYKMHPIYMTRNSWSHLWCLGGDTIRISLSLFPLATASDGFERSQFDTQRPSTNITSETRIKRRGGSDHHGRILWPMNLWTRITSYRVASRKFCSGTSMLCFASSQCISIIKTVMKSKSVTLPSS
jgi:hypothetical protein